MLQFSKMIKAKKAEGATSSARKQQGIVKTNTRYDDVFQDLINQEVKMFPKYHNGQITNEPPLDPPSSLYDDGWVDEMYYEECKKLAHNFKDTKDALEFLFTELYDSAHEINQQTIDAACYYLCDQFGMDHEILSYGLNVVHIEKLKERKDPEYLKWFSGISKAHADMTIKTN